MALPLLARLGVGEESGYFDFEQWYVVFLLSLERPRRAEIISSTLHQSIVL